MFSVAASSPKAEGGRSNGANIKLHPRLIPNNQQGDQAMRNRIISSLSVIPAIVLLFLWASNALGQDMGTGNFNEGYGTYGTMGSNPDDILDYGRGMMRYGFHETGMSGGSSKYPGYDRNLNAATIKKLNTEQESFIKSTEDLRQIIYEKELYLKSELAKREPEVATALSLQSSLSEARGKFEQKMIEHLLRMKKINLEADTK